MIAALDLAWIHFSSFILGMLVVLCFSMVVTGLIVRLASRIPPTPSQAREIGEAEERVRTVLKLHERGLRGLYVVRPSELVSSTVECVN